MKYIDFVNNDNYNDDLVVILKKGEVLYLAAELNYNAGECDCCKAFSRHDDVEVVKIYDGYTLEVLYNGEEL